MGDREEFLRWIGTRLKDAEVALYNGDANPRLAIWSNAEPVSVLGAWRSANGSHEVAALFHGLGRTFSECTSFAHEVIAAHVSGDQAYTAGYEHMSASVNGRPRAYTLRVTQVYRREDGEWRVAHRHADVLEERDR
ncbi:DUF4440 domain-containing protein [Georgenia sp. SUBG003]|uniref:DUF4440 domain-containing protein n=1 Tax=Georgenia sp. SUBG003 TaxID=1497974 RepID=UPI0004DA91E4|nr:hypothetical protein DA06_07335 [Georgenia sp. SUBG003]